jgi:tetratricopeptide (TPR) repeat protein
VSGRIPAADRSDKRLLAPDLPRRWRPVIERCLDPDPARRYPSVAYVRQALPDQKVRRRAMVLTASAALVPLAVLLWPVVFPPTPAARLAILPLEAIDADPQTATLVQGATIDLSARLVRLRPRPPQLVVIPVQETRSRGATSVDEARQKLGASHVLGGTMARRDDRLVVHSSIVDTTTKIPLREMTGDYATGDIGAVPAVLSAMVAEVFRLPRQRAAEAVAPAAYAAYAEGSVWLQSGPSSYARAVAAFEQAIELDTQSVLPRAGLAEACYRAWEATSDARWLSRGRDALAKAEALNADSLAVRLAAGKLSLVPGSFDRAAREYGRATELNPTSAEAWGGLARAYMEMQDRDHDAAAAFMKAVEVQPGYYLPLLDFGDFWRRRGNYVEAEKQWQQVVNLAPRLLAGHVNLGGLYSDMGRYQDAERELTRALEIEPSRGVLNNLGSLYQYMGRDEEAIRFLERARAAGPATHILLLNLGDSYRRLGRAGEAKAAYRDAGQLAEAILRSNPRDAAARAFVAYCALRLGDRSTAERELIQALNLGGEIRTVVRRAAISYEALGERDRALAVLESAPPDVLRELSRQPDLARLREDPRFVRLLPKETR